MKTSSIKQTWTVYKETIQQLTRIAEDIGSSENISFTVRWCIQEEYKRRFQNSKKA